MRVHRLHVSRPLQVGETVVLTGDRAHYLGRVLRAQPGQVVCLFNGDGGEYRGEVITADRRSVTLHLDEYDPIDRLPAPAVHLGLGLIKPDRFEWALEKSTELGVATVTPLITAFTDRLPPKRQWPKKQARWQHIAAAACEQCGRNRPPTVTLPQPLEDWLAACRAPVRWMADPSGPALQPTVPSQATALLVGPEGGLSREERTRAEQTGFQPVSLGVTVLRAETAALAGLAHLLC